MVMRGEEGAWTDRAPLLPPSRAPSLPASLAPSRASSPPLTTRSLGACPEPTDAELLEHDEVDSFVVNSSDIDDVNATTVMHEASPLKQDKIALNSTALELMFDTSVVAPSVDEAVSTVDTAVIMTIDAPSSPTPEVIIDEPKPSSSFFSSMAAAFTTVMDEVSSKLSVDATAAAEVEPKAVQQEEVVAVTPVATPTTPIINVAAPSSPIRTAVPTESTNSPPAVSVSLSESQFTPTSTDSLRQSKDEQMVSVLQTKKRTLLSEIGALLTLRERLIEEAIDVCSQGLPFDYAERFAASPATLLALESIAEQYRSTQREQKEKETRERRAEDKAKAQVERILMEAKSPTRLELARSVELPHQEPELCEEIAMETTQRPCEGSDESLLIPSAIAFRPQPKHLQHRPSTAPILQQPQQEQRRTPNPALYSMIPDITTPDLTPIHTPARTRKGNPGADEEEEQSAMEETASQQKTNVKRVIFPTSSEIPLEDHYVRPNTAPYDGRSSHAPVIAATAVLGEESYLMNSQSVYLDEVLDDQLESLHLEATQTMVMHQQQSPPQRATPSKFHHPAPTRPPTLSASGRHIHPPPQFVKTPSSVSSHAYSQQLTSPASISSAWNAASPVSAGSTFSPSSHFTSPHPSSVSTTSTPAPLGYLARKALQLRQAEQESLDGFQGETLLGVQTAAVQREHDRMRHMPHFERFQQTGNHSSHSKGSHLLSAPSARGTPSHDSHSGGGNFHAPVVVSPAREKRTPLSNVTNTGRKTPSVGMNSDGRKSSGLRSPMDNRIAW